MANDQSIVTTIEADSAGADEGFASAEEAAASFGEALSALAAQAEEMSASISAAVDAMTASMDDAAGSVSALAGSMDAAGGSADAAAGSLGALGGSADAASASVKAEGDAAATTAAKNDAAATSTDGLSGAFGKLKMPLLVAGAAVVGIGIAAVHMAGDFQDSMTQLVTGAGESQKNLATVSAGVLQISAQVGTSAKDTAAGLYLIESAGYHGSAGLAVLKAAEEGAKVGGAQMATVADATTTVLNDFGSQGVTAANAVNALIATVAQGKTHLQDLGQSLAQILPTASAAHVGLNDVMGAMATMTSEGVPAANAATYLRQTILALDAPSSAAQKALKSVGLSSSQVAAEMQKSLPDALAMITEAVGKKFPVGSAAYVAALKDISGGSKTMQGMLDLTGNHLATFRTDVGNVADAVKKGGSSIIGWSDVQKDFNTKLAQTGVAAQNMLIALGQQIMPVAEAVMSKLMPAITGITTWIEGHGKQAAQIFGILAAAIGGALVTALVGAAVAAGPIVLIAAGIAAAAGGIAASIALLATHWKQVTTAIQPALNVLRALWSFIQPLAVALKNQLGAVVAQLGETFRTQLLPAWQQLQAAFNQAKPILIALAAVIAGIIIVNLAIFIGVLKGVLMMIGPVASGLIKMLGGAFQVVAGIIRLVTGVVGGLVQFWVDLFTGKFGKLKGDLLNIWNAITGGIGQILSGLGNIISGFFGGLFGGIKGFLSGLVSGVIGFFQNLFDRLVGHSIIPDMISSMVGVFAGLPGKALNAVLGLDAKLVGFFSGLAQKALSWGANIISSLASGITSKLGAVTNAVGNVAGKIKGFLGFGSPTKEGPGSTADTWMPNLVAMMAAGLTGSTSKLQAAAAVAAGSIAVGLAGATAGAGRVGALGLAGTASSVATSAVASAASSAAGAAGGIGGLGGGQQSTAILSQLLAETRTQNGYLARIASGAGAGVSGANAGTPRPLLPTITINGGSSGGSIQQIAAQLNQLGGYAAEYANRGATAGVAYNG